MFISRWTMDYRRLKDSNYHCAERPRERGTLSIRALLHSERQPACSVIISSALRGGIARRTADDINCCKGADVGLCSTELSTALTKKNYNLFSTFMPYGREFFNCKLTYSRHCQLHVQSYKATNIWAPRTAGVIHISM